MNPERFVRNGLVTVLHRCRRYGGVAAIFDGERVFVANEAGTVSLFKAADFTPLGSVSIGGGTVPFGGCADGVSVWIALNNAGSIARF